MGETKISTNALLFKLEDEIQKDRMAGNVTDEEAEIAFDVLWDMYPSD